MGELLIGNDQSYLLNENPISSKSLLISGEAHSALAALNRNPSLLPCNKSIKLCYIDPPYNTGERFAYYDDRKKSDQWLDELKNNLLELRPLLSHDASVWLHLDDSEQHRARVVLDEVFGREAFVATIIWQKRVTRESRKAFSPMHDYIHVYAPNGPKAWKQVRNGVGDPGVYSNPDDDPRGPWRSAPISVQAGHATASQFYTLVTPTGKTHEPPVGRCWAYAATRLAELDSEGRIYWPRGGDGKPRLKNYQNEAKGLAPFTIWTADETGDTSSAKKALMKQFPDVPTFDTPKPEKLLDRIIQIATNPGDLIIDFYLGSGTTAVSAQKLSRKWIGVERSAETISRFAIPRLTTENARSGIDFSILEL
ncbi:MAG: site-specific DNA-methyltransferase [Glutamicibacter ardleyensis]